MARVSIVTDSSIFGSADWAVIKEAPLNPMWGEYGAKFDGSTDDTAAWTLVFAALPTKGGEIYVPPAGTSIVSQIALPVNSTDVVIRGGGGRNGNDASCRLLSNYSGSGPVFAANAAAGLRMSGLRIENENSAFTGKILDLSRGAGTQDTTQFHLESMILRAVAQSGSAVNLLELTKATVGTVEGVYFYGGNYGAEGLTASGDYCNTVTIGDGCLFSTQATAALHNLGNGCRVKGVTFEPLQSGAAGAYLQDPSLPGEGLSWICNWTGDGNGSGTWIIWNGSNLTVFGGLLATATNGIELNGTANGLLIDGVWFNSLTAALNLNSETFADVHLGAANTFNSVTNVIAPATGQPFVWSNESIMLGCSTAAAVSFEAANGNGRGYFRLNSNGTPVLGNAGGGDVLKIGDSSATWETIGLLGTIKNENSSNEVTTATAGTATLPANPVGFLIFVDHSGNTRKIPYYAA